MSDNVEAHLADSFGQTCGLNKHVKLFGATVAKVDKCRGQAEELSVREKIFS